MLYLVSYSLNDKANNMAKLIRFKDKDGTTVYSCPFYPIDSIVVTSTNENPSAKLGGRWELIDKEFKSSADNNTIFFSANSNATTKSCLLIRAGHTLRIRLNFTNKVEITDSGAVIGEFNYNLIGIVRTNIGLSSMVGGTDNGNCTFIYDVNHSTGSTFIGDVVGENSLATNSNCFIDFTVPIQKEYMLDSFCDKFYWKRIA